MTMMTRAIIFWTFLAFLLLVNALPSSRLGVKLSPILSHRKNLQDNENAVMVQAAMLPTSSVVTSTLSAGLADAVSLYSNILLLRIALSWFPQVFNQFPILRPLLVVTDPYLRVFRKVIPTVGGLDLSPLPAFFLLNVLSSTAAAVGAEMPITTSSANKKLHRQDPRYQLKLKTVGKKAN
eukprot:gene1623-1781_t